MTKTKEDVMYALTACAFRMGCESCPYDGLQDCKEKLCNDAVCLLKANEPAKSKYTLACIYTKKGDLLPYLNTGKVLNENHPSPQTQADAMHRYYAQEREIQLIALFRWEGSKCFCKIKCPVNPLPIKGEFEAASMDVLDKFLKANGWSYKQKFYPRMFK